MDLQTAEISNLLSLKVTRIMAFICFALTGLMLVASLQAQHAPKTGAAAKSAASSTFVTTSTL